ncbi:MAG TPA: hypothetical protein VGR14_08715 [Verrucomicrobiae bacterium]|nr:hypothetical protein [Verrucomicrobiae bacterium]
MQSYETCLFLFALGRFPSALVVCATAWESVMRAKLGLALENDLSLDALIDQIQNSSGTLKTYDRNKLHTFRKTRNRIAHYGFSPKDDEECARLLLETGLPFLNRCYRELFDFYLDWQDIRPGNNDFSALNSEEMAKAGLLPEVAEHLRVVSRVYARARQLGGLGLSYCFRGFGKYISVRQNEMSFTATEARILQRGDENGVKFEHEMKEKEEVAKIFDVPWEFDCPICEGCDCLIGELDDGRLDIKQVSVRRCACVSCGLVVPQGSPFLADELLREQLENESPRILKELGIR